MAIKGLESLSKIVKATDPELSFNILEIGAVPLDGEEERFYSLLELFPGSRISGLEVDEKLCMDLNSNSGSVSSF